MALLKEYFKLTNEYRDKYGEKTLLLMEVGSFFEVYTKVDPISKEITDQQVIDLRKCKEAVTLNGYLLDNSTTPGLTQKGYLFEMMRATATTLSLSWGAGGTYESMDGNISKVDIKEEPGRLIDSAATLGSETKRYNIQLVFIRGTHKG